MRGTVRFALTAALTAAALLPAAAPAAAQELRVGVDPRVEFMAIVWKLAGAREYNQDRYEEYNAAIREHFAPVADHAALERVRAVRDTAGLSFSTVMDVAVHLTAPPMLEPRLPFDREGRGRTPATERLLPDLRRFAEDSRFAEFYAAQHEVYDSADARMRRLVDQHADVGWFARFFGTEPAEDFVVVPLLANSGTNFGPDFAPPGERREVYAILGHERTDSAGFVVYDPELVATLVHEFVHSWANALGWRYMADFERSAPRVHAVVEDAMRDQAYGEWTSMVNESLVRAAVARYYHARGEHEQLRRYLAEEREQGWYWTGEMAELLGEYEADRARYPTLNTFMPRILEYWDSLPGRVEAMKQAYDATRPRLVSISVEHGATGVDPALREIVVRYDRAMSDSRWAVRPGPAGAEAMPEVTGRTWSDDRTEVRIGVVLEPGREYELQINSPVGYGFRSAEEDVPAAPYLLRFRTAEARGAG